MAGPPFYDFRDLREGDPYYQAWMNFPGNPSRYSALVVLMGFVVAGLAAAFAPVESPEYSVLWFFGVFFGYHLIRALVFTFTTRRKYLAFRCPRCGAAGFPYSSPACKKCELPVWAPAEPDLLAQGVTSDSDWFDDWYYISTPFLDTDHSAEDLVGQADKILRERGYSDRKISWLRRGAMFGLGWNLFFWWEWRYLDFEDVVRGWRWSLVVCALFLSLPVLIHPVFAVIPAAAIGGYVYLLRLGKRYVRERSNERRRLMGLANVSLEGNQP